MLLHEGVQYLNSISKGACFSISEFTSTIDTALDKNHITSILVNDLIYKINNKITNDYFIKKRKDAFILVPNKLNNETRDKNIVTIWLTNSSISLVIQGSIKRKSYHSVSELDDTLINLISNKHSNLIEKFQ